ncbi:MAG: hypothetical protein ACRERD_32030, partial [Candidatus Binatia bacterium]
GLPWRTRGTVILANGSEDQFDIYAAIIRWDGTPRNILVEAADTDPLVGMALLLLAMKYTSKWQKVVMSSSKRCREEHKSEAT